MRDPAGLAVAGATAELREASTGLRHAVLTGERGEYHFAALLPGAYTVTVRKDGFRTLLRTGIELRVADRVAADLNLTLGDRNESVDVTASAPMLQTAGGALGFGVEGHSTTTLPLDGRNFIPLIALAPGVMLPPGQFLPRINGSRPRTSEYLYDGVSVLEPEPGQVAYYPVLDSIAEFRVQTNS